jgi:hypothetical protein
MKAVVVIFLKTHELTLEMNRKYYKIIGEEPRRSKEMKIEQVGKYLVCEFDIDDISEAYDFLVNNFNDEVDDEVHEAYKYWTNEQMEISAFHGSA